ncbi:MAG: N-acetylglucosamine-6-phosphate deacetylase [Clostridia bacterium]|nr:N-acetylglucosamine-6-phosphate deacetylase [Clostridia bacterium]
MRAIMNGKIVLKDSIVENKALLFDEKIVGISDSAEGCELIDAKGGYVTPGLIDIHTHGYLGYDCSDGELAGLTRMAEGIAKNGVTSFLATTMTMPYEELEKAFEISREYMKAPSAKGAHVVGVNAEGPFLSEGKRGAHMKEYLKAPDPDFLLKYKDIIRVTTIAPDIDGAMDAIKKLTENGIRVSAGHTVADFNTTIKAIDMGASIATHTFNAMPALGHREPGATGAFLWDDRVYCELIADTFHVHTAFYKILKRIKGDKLVIITDCLRSGGMPDGEYISGGLKVRVEGIRCLLENGTIAGSMLHLNKGVKNMIDFGGAEVWEAVAMASLNAANAIGVADAKGSIEIGKDADIAIFDAEFDTMQTIIGGKTVYSA